MEISDALKYEILKKLQHNSKNKPSEKKCKLKIEFAITMIASIAKDPSPNTAALALEIVKKLQIYLKDVSFPTLDKLILKILNKIFIEEMLGLIKNIEDPDVIAGICYVKYKHLNIVDERIFHVYPSLKGEIKYKIEKHFKDVLLVKVDLKEEHSHLNTSASSSSKSSGLIPDNEASIFKIVFGKAKKWSDIKGYFNLGKGFEKILLIAELISNSKLRDAKAELLSLLTSIKGAKKLILYNMLAYIHFLGLEYHEALFYLDLSLEAAVGDDYHFSLNCKFLLERHAGISSILPMVDVDFSLILLDIEKDTSLIGRYFENKFLIRQVYKCSFQRIMLYSKVPCKESHLKNFFSALEQSLPDFSIFFLFSSEKNLYIYDALDPKTCVKVEWDNLVSDFRNIMAENKKVLSMPVGTSDEKRHWWSIRIRLDQSLGRLLKELQLKIKLKQKGKLLLVLEDLVSFFPFEAVFDVPAVRILSHDIIFQLASLDIKSIFYLLDPADDLKNTRSAISEYFRSKGFENEFLNGVIGRPLIAEEIKETQRSELFMYFGHGTGKKYFDFQATMPKLLFLFGCSSCRLVHVKNFKSNGVCLRHLKKKRGILGNLWDVTDKDLDKFTIAFLDDFFSGKSIPDAIYMNRKVCKLRFLNSAALVTYGINPFLHVK
ncbi:Separin [Glugoides intestinalis]